MAIVKKHLVIICFLAIINYLVLATCNYYKLLLAILSYFILGYFRLYEDIVGYVWQLKAISPYVIIDNSRLLYVISL